MYKTLTQVTQGVVNKIGLVSGTIVQTYTEPQIKVAVQDAFTMLFRKRFWEHMSDWYRFQVDPTTGLVTTDLSAILKSFEDVRELYSGDTSQQRLTKPVGREHLIYTGTQLLWYSPLKYTDINFTTRVIKFWPETAGGTVDLYIRTMPDTFKDDSLIPFPNDLMEWAGAWMMLETDGINPTNSNKCQQLYQIAYNDYLASINDDVIGTKGGRNAHTFWQK